VVSSWNWATPDDMADSLSSKKLEWWKEVWRYL